MKSLRISKLISTGIVAMSCVIVLASCDRTSSPEGRMSIKMEDLQKSMIDSLKQQNVAILDSLSKIRQEIELLKQSR